MTTRTEPSRRTVLLLLRGVAVALAVAPGGAALAGIAPEQAHELKTFSATEADRLLRLSRELVPLRDATEAHYFAVVAALDGAATTDPGKATIVRQALSAAAPPAPFLALFQSAALPALLNSAAVWKLLGYEGESYSQGGYLTRGFHDIGWLSPPPRTAQGALDGQD